MKDVFSVGETMVIFQADHYGRLEDTSALYQKIGGAESNVLIGLARLGHDVAFISQVGNDPFGKKVIKTIRAEGVDVSNVKVIDDAPTGVLFKELRTKNETYIYYYRKNSAASKMSVATIPENVIIQSKYIHITGITPALSQSCREMTFKIIEIAKKHNIPIIFDPNIRFKLWDEKEAKEVILRIAEQSDYILTGISEAEFLVGTKNEKEICRLLSKKKSQVVVIKKGAEPTIYSLNGQLYEVPTVVGTEILDPVGAGDAFASGFIHGLLTNQTIDTSVAYGNVLGACVIQQYGDIEGLPTLEEFERLYQSNEQLDVLR
ncbi:sugar kinase [Lysinibacillus sp. PLM2]|nr:sugar kinase [Lysinibacillus sp. PLM2]